MRLLALQPALALALPWTICNSGPKPTEDSDIHDIDEVELVGSTGIDARQTISASLGVDGGFETWEPSLPQPGPHSDSPVRYEDDDLAPEC